MEQSEPPRRATGSTARSISGRSERLGVENIPSTRKCEVRPDGSVLNKRFPELRQTSRCRDRRRRRGCGATSCRARQPGERITLKLGHSARGRGRNSATSNRSRFITFFHVASLLSVLVEGLLHLQRVVAEISALGGAAIAVQAAWSVPTPHRGQRAKPPLTVPDTSAVTRQGADLGGDLLAECDEGAGHGGDHGLVAL